MRHLLAFLKKAYQKLNGLQLSPSKTIPYNLHYPTLSVGGMETERV